jgi:Helix-turn-helix domain
VSSADLADLAIPATVVITPEDNPWVMSVSQAARVLRRSPSTVRAWCTAGWYVGGLLLAKRVGGEWMIHGARFADWLAQETP